MNSVPDFFQGDTLCARRDQLNWLESHLSLDDEFFAGVLSTDGSSIERLRQNGDHTLDASQEKMLGDLWGMFLHVMSATNFEDELGRKFLTAVAVPSSLRSPGIPCVPWAGQSLRTFLEQKGPRAIRDVTAWLTSPAVLLTDRLQPHSQAARNGKASQHRPNGRNAGIPYYIPGISDCECGPPFQSSQRTRRAA